MVPWNQEPRTRFPEKFSDSILVLALGPGPVLNTDPRAGTKIRPKSFPGIFVLVSKALCQLTRAWAHVPEPRSCPKAFSGILVFGSWFHGTVSINTGPSLGTKIEPQSCSSAPCTNPGLIWAAAGLTPTCFRYRAGFWSGVPSFYSCFLCTFVLT